MDQSIAYEEWLGSPDSGDFQMGVGTSTSQLANPNVSIAAARGTGTSDPISGGPATWVVIVVLLIAIKLLAEKAGKAGEFSTVKIGFENWLLVGLMASTFIFAAKTATKVWPQIPALTNFFGAA